MLAFKSPVLSRAAVVEESLKNGKTAKMRYELRFAKHPSGKDLRVSLQDFEFLELIGQNAPAARYKAQLAPALAVASAMAARRIGTDGSVLQVEGGQATVRCVIAEMTKTSLEDPQLLTLAEHAGSAAAER